MDRLCWGSPQQRRIAPASNEFPDVKLQYLGEWGSKFDDDLGYLHYDIVISYLSRWIVPSHILDRAGASINFHPASSDYPGIGCNNFALYEGAKEYGVTCHFMAPVVDAGDIIASKRFPVYAIDDVASLLHRTYDFQLVLFYEVLGRIANGEKLVPSGEKWSRKAFTRKQFEALSTLTPEMSEEEMSRRVRACSYEHWSPKMHINGLTFTPLPVTRERYSAKKVTFECSS